MFVNNRYVMIKKIEIGRMRSEFEKSRIGDDIMQGLLEAAEIKKGNIPLVRKEDMLVPTFIADDKNNDQ